MVPMVTVWNVQATGCIRLSVPKRRHIVDSERLMRGRSPASPEGVRYLSRAGGGVVASGQTGGRRPWILSRFFPRRARRCSRAPRATPSSSTPSWARAATTAGAPLPRRRAAATTPRCTTPTPHAPRGAARGCPRSAARSRARSSSAPTRCGALLPPRVAQPLHLRRGLPGPPAHKRAARAPAAGGDEPARGDGLGA